jgi:hypothetical protein
VADESGALVEAWVVESKIGPQTVKYWIAKDTRDVLQSVLEAGPGVQLKMVR